MKKLMNCLNFGLLTAFLVFSVNVFAQPANDECANAMDISSLFDGACNISNLSMVIDNTGATGNATDPPEPGDDAACPGLGTPNLFGDASTLMETSIWFTFTVPDLNGDGSPVTYSLWTSDGSYGDCGLNPNNILGGDADTQVAIYETNTCPDNNLGVCDYFAANEDLFTSPPWISGWLDLMFTPGQTYYMLIDTWDGVVGEFCLSVTPCGTVCGDDECAPVETFCDCSGDCACDFANFTLINYNPDTDGYNISDYPPPADDIVAICPDFFGISGSDNIYLNVGASNFTDCGGATSDITVIYDNGTLIDTPGGTAFPSGAAIPVLTVFFFELTPADVAVGSITFNACVDDGLGGQCCQDLVFDFSLIPGIADPYCPCVAGSVTDPAIITQNACPGQTIEVCTDGNEDLSLPCADGFTYQYAWRVEGLVYGSSTILSNFVVAGACATLNVDDFLIDEFGYAPPSFTPGEPLAPGSYTIQGAALCVDAAGNVDSGCFASGQIAITILDAADPLCQGAPGCTDPAFCEFDPAATIDDGSCVTSNMDPGTCDDGDCTNGVESWDMATCTCMAGTPPTTLGCTDATFCEFDPAATCDDGSCVTSNMDPGTCDDGDCTNGVETWDMTTCTCMPGTPPTTLGCTDATFCEFDPAATCDDGSCVTSNMDPGTCDDGDCTNGLENWDMATCTCVSTPPSGITGCTDPAFCEYDPTADCDDGSCATSNMDPGTCDDGDCTNGLETWDMATCTCISNPPSGITGCTDPAFCEYDPTADCDDGSCSNPLPTAATIAGGPFSFCAGDGTPDFVSGITLNGGSGTNGAWVVTDAQLNILGLPGMPGDVDFDTAGFGTCLIWYLNFEDIAGAEVGMNVGDLTGCFALSNSIEVERMDCTAVMGSYDIDGEATDPCFCGNDLNVLVDPAGDPADPTQPVAYFYESAELTTSPATSGLTITSTEIGILDASGNPVAVVWTDEGDGTYSTAFYHADAVGFQLLNITGTSADGSIVVDFLPDLAAVCQGCNGLCQGTGEIGGNILTNADCSVAGTAVTVTDAAGMPVGVAITDANGNWSLTGGPFDCGEYIALIDVSSVPACYIDAGGDVGPTGFTVGDGGVYGVDFNSFDEVPTLSQWGLMSLALLLMIFGGIKLATVNNVQLNRKNA